MMRVGWKVKHVGESRSDMIYTTIGELVKNYRGQANLTLSQLANITGISKGVLSKIENGDTKRPELKTIKPLAKTLHIPYAEIMEHYLELEQRTEVLRDLLLEAVTMAHGQLAAKAALRYLQSPQEESCTSLERLYELASSVEDRTIKLALFETIIKYATEHGVQQYVARGLLQKYLIERDDFSKLEATYHSGKYVLYYRDFLPALERIVAHYKLGVHAYNLRLFEECINLCQQVIAEDRSESRIKADATLAICNAYYYLEDFRLAEHYLELFGRYPYPHVAETVKVMTGAINGKKGNLDLAIAQLNACLTDSSDNTTIHIVTELFEIYLKKGDLSAIEDLLKLEERITDVKIITPFKKSELALFYKLKGDYYMLTGKYEDGINSYMKSAVEYGKVGSHTKVQECIHLIIDYYGSSSGKPAKNR